MSQIIILLHEKYFPQVQFWLFFKLKLSFQHTVCVQYFCSSSRGQCSARKTAGLKRSVCKRSLHVIYSSWFIFSCGLNTWKSLLHRNLVQNQSCDTFLMPRDKFVFLSQPDWSNLVKDLYYCFVRHYPVLPRIIYQAHIWLNIESCSIIHLVQTMWTKTKLRFQSPLLWFFKDEFLCLPFQNVYHIVFFWPFFLCL